jgi:hypothetical protein
MVQAENDFPSSRRLFTRALEGRPIVSHKFLNTLGCELMGDVKALPGTIKVQLFVWNLLQDSPLAPTVL